MTASFVGDDYYPSIYHSVYDDFYWMEHFGDPGFRYHLLMSQFWGVTALRLANADVLPLDFELYGRNIQTFIDELAKRTPPGGHLDLGSLRQAAVEFERAGARLERDGARGAGRARPRCAAVAAHQRRPARRRGQLAPIRRVSRTGRGTST